MENKVLLIINPVSYINDTIYYKYIIINLLGYMALLRKPIFPKQKIHTQFDVIKW